jgi:hypothetical protein
MWFGIAAMFLYQLFLLPLTALVVGAIALGRNDPGRQGGKWMAWVGLCLGGLYTLMAMVHYASAWTASVG